MVESATRRAVLLGGAALLLGRSSAAARPAYERLFHIERSKNANIVQYDAVLDAPEQLNAKTPVVAYWVLLAEDGRRESLTLLERRAYGFKVVPEPRSSSWLLYLGPTSDRSIRILRWQGRWIPQMLIGGKNAMLTRMFVSADDSSFIPSVRWIDLFGVDLVTGARVSERLKP